MEAIEVAGSVWKPAPDRLRVILRSSPNLCAPIFEVRCSDSSDLLERKAAVEGRSAEQRKGPYDVLGGL